MIGNPIVNAVGGASIIGYTIFWWAMDWTCPAANDAYDECIWEKYYHNDTKGENAFLNYYSVCEVERMETVSCYNLKYLGIALLCGLIFTAALRVDKFYISEEEEEEKSKDLFWKRPPSSSLTFTRRVVTYE